ncbi:unnamed protein product [Absidia cylindrospora]
MTTFPLPYISLSFETVEARLWAMETIDNLFTGSTPKDAILDCSNLADVGTARMAHRTQQLSRKDTTSSTSSSLTTVSTSSLASAPSNDSPSTANTDAFSFNPFVSDFVLSGHHEDGTCQDQRQHDSAIFTNVSSSSSPQESSVPNRLSRRSTISSSLKRRFTLDESTSINVRRLFISEQLQKERRAHSMWQETLHEYLLDPAFGIPTPRFTMDSPRLANCIVSELLSTEETYRGHLSMLKQAFIDPFSQRFQNRYMIRDLQTIFSHIPPLISLSTTLVHRWRMMLEQQTYGMNDTTKKDQTIGKAFCDLEDEFQIYVYYAVHYAKAKKCIARMEQKPSYRQWMHSVLQNKELDRMELADYLISPIQRITRYCLLMKDLCKHTDGYPMELERTLKFLTALAVAMNNCQN